jgi:guanylate kinase
MTKSYPPMTKRRGLMFVLSSPSGAGKTVTTRAPRVGEVDGTDYYFIDSPKYDAMVAANDLLEHAVVFDNKYGTPKKQVMDSLASGRDVLFDIDWQGTRQLAQTCRADLVSVFILPPTLDELERRLRSRAQDSEAVVQKRMARAVDEISHWEEYDYVVVNEDLDKAMQHIRRILYAERFKRWRQLDISDFVAQLCQRAG